MKKKILGGLLVVAIAAVAAFNVNMNTQESELSLLALANVEALASESGGNCDNSSGYKRWDTSATGLGGLVGNTSSSEFYDCCRKLREGYKPTGSCS